MSATARPAGAPGPLRVPLSATVASEWTKLATRRSGRVLLGLGVILAVGLSALIGLAVGATYGDWGAAERADFDPVLVSMAGGIVTVVLFSVLGVTAATSEYASGMIRLTLTATPRRGRLLGAKALVVALTTLAGGIAASVGMFLAAQAVLGAHGAPTAGLGDPDALRAVLATGALAPAFPVIGVALGLLLRSAAGAITAVLALLFAPGIIAPLLPDWWRENVLTLLPGAASDSVTIAHLEEGGDHLDPAVGAVVLAAWVAGFLLLALGALLRRDA